MQPLLPEKESGNGTGAKMLAQAKSPYQYALWINLIADDAII